MAVPAHSARRAAGAPPGKAAASGAEEAGPAGRRERSGHSCPKARAPRRPPERTPPRSPAESPGRGGTHQRPLPNFLLPAGPRSLRTPQQASRPEGRRDAPGIPSQHKGAAALLSGTPARRLAPREGTDAPTAPSAARRPSHKPQQPPAGLPSRPRVLQLGCQPLIGSLLPCPSRARSGGELAQPGSHPPALPRPLRPGQRAACGSQEEERAAAHQEQSESAPPPFPFTFPASSPVSPGWMVLRNPNKLHTGKGASKSRQPLPPPQPPPNAFHSRGQI